MYRARNSISAHVDLSALWVRIWLGLGFFLVIATTFDCVPSWCHIVAPQHIHEHKGTHGCCLCRIYRCAQQIASVCVRELKPCPVIWSSASAIMPALAFHYLLLKVRPPINLHICYNILPEFQ